MLVLNRILYFLLTSFAFFALFTNDSLIASPLDAFPIEIQNQLKPFLMNESHPIKRKLDRLFKKTRVTESPETFEKAGFGKPHLRKSTNIVIGKHKDFKGYIFKVYLDSQPKIADWDLWITRIKGAEAIQSCIRRHGFQHFSVPKKWIYLLPTNCTSKGPNPKTSILIVEDMNILDSKSNLQAFKTKITPKILRELYLIISEECLIDSVFPDNIPFTNNGRIAFIDTEHFHCDLPIPYEKLTKHLSPYLQIIWSNLTK